MYEEDRLLAEECERLIKVTDAASEWISRNPELVGRDREGHERELRKAKRLLRGCAAAARRTMCVGVFGPSQAGKSYLVSSLAGNAEGRLWTDLGGATHDFLSEINPPGGKESTGLVTRFTLRPHASPLPDPNARPVHVRLLSVTDLVKILANTYFSDAEPMDTPDREALLAVLDELEHRKREAPTGGLSEDEVEDIQEYIHRYFRGKARVQQLLDRHFWDRVIPLAPRLEDAERARLFGLIWDNVPAFTRLLEALFISLRALHFTPEAFCPASALVPRRHSIIDVATLGSLAPDKDDLLELAGLDGRTAWLPRVYVAALTAELIIPLRDKPAEFFQHTDLLDFPGYRSRKMFVDLRKETEEPDKLKECFLRGKVAYLFERYCAERELTSLLLCIGSGVQEVQGLGGAVYNWVADTHGSTPEQRSGKENALFFILTKSDLEFEDKAGARDVSTRWDTRLYASMELFTSHDWLQHWDVRGPFNNFFLMRNPTVKLYLFDHDQEGRETRIKPELAPFVQQFSAAFLHSPLVARHVADREATWQAFLAPHDGGFSLIRDRLAPICRPELKRMQILTTLEELLARLGDRLAPYWRTDDKEEERRQKFQLAQDLARTVLGMVKTRRFGLFLRHLTLRDQELHDLYFQARHQMQEELAASGLPQQPTPDTATRQSVDDMLADILGDEALPAPRRTQTAQALAWSQDSPTPEPYAAKAASPGTGPGERTPSGNPSETYAGELTEKTHAPFARAGGERGGSPLLRDEARTFGEHIERYWLGKLRTLADDPVMQRYFSCPPTLFAQFVHELGLGFVRLGLRETLEDTLRKASRYANVEKERLLWKQAGLAAEAINSYVDWLGFNPRLLPATERKVRFGGRERTLFPAPPEVSGLPQLSEDPAEYVDALVMDWAAALIHLVQENVRFDGVRDYNPAENARLHEILTGLAVKNTKAYK